MTNLLVSMMLTALVLPCGSGRSVSCIAEGTWFPKQSVIIAESQAVGCLSISSFPWC